MLKLGREVKDRRMGKIKLKKVVFVTFFFVSFRFYVALVSVTYFISLYVKARRLVFHLRPRDGHVIVVSGCLILTAVNLIILTRMAYLDERLVKFCKIYCDI